ncbi:MAG: hypothetical protein VYA67_27140 [Actinomycetota bacterium]|uniref:Uncharacterized protein n=1 Tax=Mycobacterium lentiflavum TaxID=141349 RepID=A0ABY3UUT8_MYCLN|nr:hypothetical protein [Mycobacterium lentiflavum]MEE3067568.1 hypothetical protein [Actinomycetota bacterium]ULP43295.1 hypothetical protein MJO58_04735 [Mycobacterium lentiflavum]
MSKRLYLAACAAAALVITMVFAPVYAGHLVIALFILVVQEFLHTGE